MKFLKKRPLVLILAIFAAGGIFFLLLHFRARPLQQENFLMGTFVRISAFGRPSAQTILKEGMELLGRMDRLFSVYRPDSDVSRINSQAGKTPVRVSRDTLELTRLAMQWAGATEGAFDPTIGPVVALWNITAKTPRIPSKEKIQGALRRVDYRGVILSGDSVGLKQKGQTLDFGGIAKGYAADRLAQFLREQGIASAMIDLGGNIVVIGKKQDGQLWRVGIQDPRFPRGKPIGFLSLSDASVVTSGTYERFFEQEDKRYHHLFSPKTGYPADNGLLSVTVVSDSSADGDALATALFVMGYEQATAFLEHHRTIRALFIHSDGATVRITLSRELEKNFTLLDRDRPVRILEDRGL